jgi:hypothetical protein
MCRWAGAVVDASGVFLCARRRNFFKFGETKPRRMVGRPKGIRFENDMGFGVSKGREVAKD